MCECVRVCVRVCVCVCMCVHVCVCVCVILAECAAWDLERENMYSGLASLFPDPALGVPAPEELAKFYLGGVISHGGEKVADLTYVTNPEGRHLSDSTWYKVAIFLAAIHARRNARVWASAVSQMRTA